MVKKQNLLSRLIEMLVDFWTVQLLELLPRDSFYVTTNGRIVDWTKLDAHTRFSVHFRLRGGKGGFGSLLRSFRIHRSTNQLMCRDLSGRRLADVKEEERLRKWIEEAGEREAEKERRRREKYEKLKSGPPKHEFNDPEYIRTREKILDEADEAFEAGIAVLSSKEDDKEKFEKKSPNLTETVNVGDDTDSGSDDDDGTSMLLPTCSRKIVKRKQPDSISGIKRCKHQKNVLSDDTEASNQKSKEGFDGEMDGQSVNVDDDKQLKNISGFCGNAEELSELNKSKSSKADKTGLNVDKVKETVNNAKLNDVGSEKAAEGNEEFANESNAGNVEIVYPLIDLASFEDVDTLMKLGLEHLKHALEVRGLKCGGSLKERAERLFAVKGLKPDEYPRALKSVQQKKKKNKQKKENFSTML